MQNGRLQDVRPENLTIDANLDLLVHAWKVWERWLYWWLLKGCCCLGDNQTPLYGIHTVLCKLLLQA